MDDGKGGDFVSVVGTDPYYLKLWYVVERNITKGTIYRFRYRALNKVGWSAFSDTAYIQAANVPKKPPVPVYVSSDSDSITMRFSQTDDNGGTPVIKYRLFKDAGDDFSSSFTEVTRYLGHESVFTVTTTDDGLALGKIYRFVYVATNSLGDSAFSNELIVGLGQAPPAPSAPLKDLK